MNSSTKLLATLLLWGAMAAPAAACGGLFCARIPVDQAGEKIVFAADGKTVTAHVQIQYQGDAKSFSWILPVPTPPKLGVGTDVLFAQLRQSTQPRFRLAMRDEGPCERWLEEVRRDRVYAPAPSKAMRGGVTVVSQEQVGPYDTAVLQANDAGVLKAWLRKNNYVIPPKLDPLLDPYVAGKYSFVALKLTKDRSAGDIQPITMTYKATKPGIPIRLTGIAAKPDMDIWVWVLGKQRAIPENYRHARINEAKIDWLQGGSNYKEVVTRAVDEAGGQAFVTDYAGPADVVPAEKFTRGHFKLDSLARKTDPVAFAKAIVEDGFFGEQYGALNQDALVAFLKKHIRKPRSLAKEDDKQFYRFIEDHAEALHEAGIKVDTRKAIAELEAKVVRPSEGIARMFERSPYLTAMYTTMSPQEMTQDPTFRFNGGLEDVEVVHKANGVRHCKKGVPYWQSPVEITLANGRHFTVEGSHGGPFRRGGVDPGAAYAAGVEDNGPYAEVIEQMHVSGQPAVIQDNRAVIARSLEPLPAPTNRQPWYAGLAIGLALAGLTLRLRRR